MDKKRKLPPRGAARLERDAKKRIVTPPSKRSVTPASAPEPEPVAAEEPPPPPLPKSIAPGKPLPTVETPQPEDLPSKEYQSVQESGVLNESLVRSRQKWISEGIFQKYWSKPIKKKGVVIEEPNNPPKDSMVKLGQVTITVEPHVFEATMYAVKDPKPPPPPPTNVRPVLQYGPPNGVMPPPPTPKSGQSTKTSTPTPAATEAQASPAQTPVQTPKQTPQQLPVKATGQAQPISQPQKPPLNAPLTQEVPRPSPVVPSVVSRAPVASPRGMESVLSPVAVVPQPAPRPPPAPPTAPASYPPRPMPAPTPPGTTLPSNTAVSMRPAGGAAKPLGKPPASTGPGAAKTAPGTDPIILTLAEKAGEDPELRDLMKRVAQGDAAKHELERFQAIIDAITAESKRKGNTQGPSADRLLVDGRTVRYFADEVRAILDIVLSSKPNQTSADLRPPAGSDPLVVMLVKAALDEDRTRDIVRRIADNKPQYSDATDLKAILDRLRNKLNKEKDRQQTQSPAPSATSKANGVVTNGQASSPAPGQQQSQAQAPAQPVQQALRSKGPPPPPKPDISAIVLEFAGGTGDRYLFPKFSILEYVPVPGAGQGPAHQQPQQVIASFLIVRKGSKSEYPVADPELDFYQPVTARLYTNSGRQLENLARVVAPKEDVRRYMDDVMDKMTRAEYILLAMRLPRGPPGEGVAVEAADDKEKEKEAQATGTRSRSPDAALNKKPGAVPPSVLWTTTRSQKPEVRELPAKSKMYHKAAMDEDDQYQSFIATVTPKEPREVQ